MSCHESLMARRRKKSRAAANAKLKKEDQSPMLVDKSLPALPPNAILQSAFLPDRESPGSLDNDTPTELSPRPRQQYQGDSSSRSSSRRPREPSTERTSSDGPTKDGLTLPTTTYRNNRHSAISQASDMNIADEEGFFIPLALDPTPLSSVTPRSTSETLVDQTKRNKDRPDKDYFTVSRNNARPQNDSRRQSEINSAASTPHIAFQEKGRQPSVDEAAIKDNIRKAQTGGKISSAKGSPSIGSDDVRIQHAGSPQMGTSKSQSSSEKFRLGDVPKGKKSTPRTESQPEFESSSRNASISLSLQKDSFNTTKTDMQKSVLGADKSATPRSSQDSRSRDEPASRRSTESSTGSSPQVSRKDSSGSKSIARKEIAPGAVKTTMSSMSSSSGTETSPSTDSSDTSGLTPTVNGKSISGPTLVQSPVEEVLAPPSRAPTRPSAPQQKLSESYMAPRAPPVPPPAVQHAPKDLSSLSNGIRPPSPKLPRWSAGGDFTQSMDEDMARILGGTDESSQSILRRVSNAVRHGRNGSEASSSGRHGHGRSVSETTSRTVASPRWPKTPILEDGTAKEISSPISIVNSPTSGEDSALLRRQLRNSQLQVAELQRQLASEKDLKTLNKKLIEKRKTVSVLDSQTEIMIKQIEVLAGFVEKAKDSRQPLDISELEDSSVKDFVQKIERLKQTVSGSVEVLYEQRNELLEEKNQIIADRDRARVEFEQLVSKNAQLADMNNDITHQIQERFKAQSGNGAESPRPPPNGLGIYTHHTKDKSNVSIHTDDASLRPSTSSTTVFGGSVSSYPHAMEQDHGLEPATVLSAPHVINIRKGQAKKFNWKKGGQTVAKGVTKGFKGAFASVQQERNERNPQWTGQSGDGIGMPYNMTVVPVESAAQMSSGSLPRSISNDPSRKGFALFNKGNIPKSMTTGSFAAAADPSVLFGSDLVERVEYEGRPIPGVVARCIQEVELRGMDIEGIYRKTGGSGQVKIIQEGFEKTEDYDISDYALDITAVTSVLKQYFRKLPVPLLTFEVYNNVLESTCE
jgi:hypothetical protein